MFLHIREIELVQDKPQTSNKIQILGKIVRITHKIDKINLISINIPQKPKISMCHPQ